MTYSKKLTAFLLAIIACITLIGCSASNTENAIIAETISWNGAFSEDSLKDKIDSYTRRYRGVDLTVGNKEKPFKIQIAKDVESYSVSRLSSVGDDVEHELSSYIDSYINSSYERSSGYLTLDASWWFEDEDSWVQEYPTWSYLINTRDVNGEVTYYYFRVNYCK